MRMVVTRTIGDVRVVAVRIAAGITAAIAARIRRIGRGRSVFRGRRVAVVRHQEARALKVRALVDDIERRRRRVDHGHAAVAAAAIAAAIAAIAAAIATIVAIPDRGSAAAAAAAPLGDRRGIRGGNARRAARHGSRSR